MDAGALPWRVRRPPGRRALAAATVLALVTGAGAAGLTRLLMLEPDWRIAGGVGVALAVALLLTVARGAVAHLDAEGNLHFGFGIPNLRVPLAAITGWRPVRTGALVGIGAAVDPARVTFLNRKGLSYRSLERYRRGLGVALVLEHLTADDLAELRAWQAKLCGSAAPILDPSIPPERLA